MAENSVLCGELRAPRFPGFYRLVLPALPHLRLRHRYRRTMKMFVMCPATIRSENTSEQAQGDLLQTQSQDDEQARETRYLLNCHDERCDRKRIHTHFLKDRNCEMQEDQNYLDTMQETHR